RIYPLSLHDALPISTYSTAHYRESTAATGSREESSRILSDLIRSQAMKAERLGTTRFVGFARTRPSFTPRCSPARCPPTPPWSKDRKSTRLNSSHVK